MAFFFFPPARVLRLFALFLNHWFFGRFLLGNRGFYYQWSEASYCSETILIKVIIEVVYKQEGIFL